MDSTRKNNDCYFYYYSTCIKGDNCLFRHEESALGCEVVCSYWKEGKCFNQHCNFRHMELKKNRKSIPCYWETQPSGCCKPHCSFSHQNPRPGIEKPKPADKEVKVEPAVATPTNRTSQGSESSFGNASVVDPVVVSFEEESDNESVPSTPFKANTSQVNVKTLEQIKLDRIQAESAAYYSFPDNFISNATSTNQDLAFRIMSLDEIRRSRKKEEDMVLQLQPDSTTTKKDENEDHRTKPIRLKRFKKETGNEPSRARLKRIKLLDNSAVSSSNMESSGEDILIEQVSCSSLKEIHTKVGEDELLKDIDALLGD